MTEEQILELAEKLKFCLRDEDDWRNWKVSPSLILEFAQEIRKQTIDEILTTLEEVPNPEANRTAINRIKGI
ncbi:hypothetical protein PQC13_gp099 [Synechococcus phage S-SRM01]|uniref:Uncharacterized protein n=1 Tax=Synechococcus phage S-SRM01 TaxID=2781608 RepID=A0A879R1I9_9CAUD|nr:hypothetical protein PQC13_gp099 [Synechococcus phage S-SRM01]QPX48064.1 hypothetical protein [Synechococcus phage S-SRM01]